MTWPFENDTHKVEKKLATQSLSANKQRNFLAGIIMFISIPFASLRHKTL